MIQVEHSLGVRDYNNQQCRVKGCHHIVYMEYGKCFKHWFETPAKPEKHHYKTCPHCTVTFWDVTMREHMLHMWHCKKQKQGEAA